jgi:hypothetical protein
VDNVKVPPEANTLFNMWVRRVGEYQATEILIRAMGDLSEQGVLEELARKNKFEQSLR